MSFDHHATPHPKANPEIEKLLQRFNEQVDKRAKREYPDGRLGADDDGVLAFAIAADPAKKKIVIDFGKPVEWIAFGPSEANQLINMLKTKLAEIGEPLVIVA